MPKINFIDDPKGVLHHYTTVALTAASSILAAWMAIPDSVKAGFPPEVSGWVQWITFVVVVAGLFGKFVDQSKPADAASE